MRSARAHDLIEQRVRGMFKSIEGTVPYWSAPGVIRLEPGLLSFRPGIIMRGFGGISVEHSRRDVRVIQVKSMLGATFVELYDEQYWVAGFTLLIRPDWWMPTLEDHGFRPHLSSQWTMPEPRFLA